MGNNIRVGYVVHLYYVATDEQSGKAVNAFVQAFSEIDAMAQAIVEHGAISMGMPLKSVIVEVCSPVLDISSRHNNKSCG